MKSFLKCTAAATVIAASAGMISAPARADSFNVGIGIGPVGFDIHSGGYCDRWGCPRTYWNYPVYYGPIYYEGGWYRGPVYYRVINGEHWYWLHGGWHRDEWRGPRPEWARVYRYGPALGLDYYRAHGFQVRDEDWREWNDRDRDRAGYYDRDERYRGYYDRDERYRGDDRDRAMQYRDNDRYRGQEDRDRYQDRDNDRGYDRDRYEHSSFEQDRDRTDTDRNANGRYDSDRRANDRNPSASDRDNTRMPGGDTDRHLQPSKYEDRGQDRNSARIPSDSNRDGAQHASPGNAAYHRGRDTTNPDKARDDDESGGYSMNRSTSAQQPSDKGDRSGSDQKQKGSLQTTQYRQSSSHKSNEQPSLNAGQSGPYQHTRYDENESPYGHGQTSRGSQGTQGRSGQHAKSQDQNQSQTQNQNNSGY